MTSMRTLSRNEIEEFLNQPSKQPYKEKGHSFTPLKGAGKQYCKCCGLVALNNAATNWCVNKGCNYSDHPSYESTMKRLTRSKDPRFM